MGSIYFYNCRFRDVQLYNEDSAMMGMERKKFNVLYVDVDCKMMMNKCRGKLRKRKFVKKSKTYRYPNKITELLHSKLSMTLECEYSPNANKNKKYDINIEFNCSDLGFSEFHQIRKRLEKMVGYVYLDKCFGVNAETGEVFRLDNNTRRLLKLKLMNIEDNDR